MNVDFAFAFLDHARFYNAHSEESSFQKAHLHGASFGSADFSRADFWGAQLQRAEFFGTKLSEANFRDAELQFASFFDIDLSDIKGLTAEMLAHTFGDSTVRLPSDILRPQDWPDREMSWKERYEWLNESRNLPSKLK
jgi:uncharacterized protein YjbI with pentapeptide repeats